MTLNSVVWEADNVRMNAVANGVLVTLACVAAIKHITATGIRFGPTNDEHAWAKGAAAKKRGNMMPPGNFPAQASAIEMNFAAPT
mmetsp:Transcript_12518/g.26664  ORF Transcript_12518/g.26664 Transcript_12518/m.26664 type:complete len:85 (+) Transcript_12518:118-372(+)